MKTTLDIPDELLTQAQRVARAGGTSLEALVADGLRIVLHGRRRPPFSLRSASFRGDGLSTEFKHAGWSDILEASDRRHG